MDTKAFEKRCVDKLKTLKDKYGDEYISMNQMIEYEKEKTNRGTEVKSEELF